jgi:transposase
MKRVGLEACSLPAWLHQALTEAGIAVICIDTRQAKAAMGAMPKTDRNDARGIAQIMRTGWYRAVHMKNPCCRSWRALLAAGLDPSIGMFHGSPIIARTPTSPAM